MAGRGTDIMLAVIVIFSQKADEEKIKYTTEEIEIASAYNEA